MEMGENRFQWLYNEGIRVSVLLAHIQQQNIDARMNALRQEMLNKLPSNPVVITSGSNGQTAGATSIDKEAKTSVQSELGCNVVTGDDGAVTWTIPFVTVTEKRSIAALQESAVDPLPSTFQGFPVEVTSSYTFRLGA